MTFVQMIQLKQKALKILRNSIISSGDDDSGEDPLDDYEWYPVDFKKNFEMEFPKVEDDGGERGESPRGLIGKSLEVVFVYAHDFYTSLFFLGDFK